MKVVFLIVWMVLSASALGAEEYCSLVVKTVDQRGIEIPAHLVVTESDGRRHISTPLNNKSKGITRFCNLGILPVEVTARISCSELVSVRVRPVWGETKTITVSLSNTPCIDTFAAPSCQFLYRMVDSAYQAIKSATISLADSMRYTSDEFGRIFIERRAGTELQGLAEGPGFRPVEIKELCRAGGGASEKSIVMEPSQ